MAFKDFLPEGQHGKEAPGSEGVDLFEFEEAEVAPTSGPAPALPRGADGKPAGSKSPRAGRETPMSKLLPHISLAPPEAVPATPRGIVLSRGLLAILFLLLAANVWTLVEGWRSQARVGAALDRFAPGGAAPFESARQEALDTTRTPAPAGTTQNTPDAAPRLAPIATRPEGYETLDVARRAIEQGDWERARRSLFALQAVADRLDATVREDILAHAAFLIGDTYRGQAEAVTAGETEAALAAVEERP